MDTKNGTAMVAHLVARRAEAPVRNTTPGHVSSGAVDGCVKAGERIRTADVQLGKRRQCHRKHRDRKMLQCMRRAGDQLGAGCVSPIVAICHTTHGPPHAARSAGPGLDASGLGRASQGPWGQEGWSSRWGQARCLRHFPSSRDFSRIVLTRCGFRCIYDDARAR